MSVNKAMHPNICCETQQQGVLWMRLTKLQTLEQVQLI